MSVKIIKSNTFEHAFVGVLRELKLNVADGRNVVIVPDKFSLSLERNILSMLNITGSFNIEVMSFTRFAQKSLKNKILRCLTPEGSVMLLSRAIAEVRGKLTFYDAASYERGFSHEMYAVMTSIRNSGITAEALSDAASKFPTGSEMNEKLSDISMIYDGYMRLLEGSHSDSSTRLLTFADEVPTLDGIERTNVYVCDFYNFTAPQYEIIDRLIASAKRVTFGFVVPSARAENKRLFPEKTVRSIERICGAHGVKPEIIDTAEILLPYKKQLLLKLFSYAKAEPLELRGEEIRMYSAANVTAEVENAARKIRRLIIESGYRYRDISVVLCDVDAYVAQIRNVFSRFDIPYFIDQKEVASMQPPLRFLLGAMNAAIEGLSLSSILPVVKNPMFYGTCGYAAVEEFENYCLMHGVKRVSDAPFVDAPASVEEVRSRAVDYLKPFIGIKDDFVGAIESFLERTAFFDKLESIEFFGDDVCTRINAQLPEKLKEILYEIKLTGGAENVNFSAFTAMLSGVLDNVKIALVPVHVDGVFVGGEKESRFDDVKAMFVLGASDGALPKGATDTAVLGTADEELLEGKGLVINPAKKENNLYELFYLTQLLIKPKERLIVSYSDKGGGSRPSVLFSQLSSLFSRGGAPLKTEYVRFDDKTLMTAMPKDAAREYAYKFSTVKNAYYQLLANVLNEAPKPYFMKPYDAAFGALPEDKKEKINRYLLPPTNKKDKVNKGALIKGNTFSASRIETYFRCPYSYYFKYGLGAEQRDEGKLLTSDTGTVIHGVVEAFVKSGMYENPDRERLRSFVDAEVKRLTTDGKLANLSDAAHKNMFRQIATESVQICETIARQIAKSEFKPAFLEAKIGDRSKGDAFDGIKLRVGEREISLVGYIDRVDRDGNNFTIIDYKTYKPVVSPSSVYSGKTVQALLYLMSVQTSDGERPCGFFYMPLTLGYKKESATRFEMEGFVTDEIALLSRLDTELFSARGSEFFPVKLKADGSVGSGECIWSDTVFTAAGAYVKQLITQALEELDGGNVSPSYLADTCKKCHYASICDFCGDADCQRTPPKIKKTDFDALLRGEDFSEEVSENEVDN